MKSILYWSPHLSHVATIANVVKSAKSLKIYSKNYRPIILDSCNEWKEFDHIINDCQIEKHKISNLSFDKYYPVQGFLKSRFFSIIIFFWNFFPLLKYLKKNKPDYLIIHLITSLPIILFFLFSFKTKLILRISGLPNLNLFRLYFWKMLGKNIYHITCPTKETQNKLINMQIFPNTKITLLEDPILEVRTISKLKKEKIEFKNMPNNFLLCIGRLTRQKNYILAVNAIKEIKNSFPDTKLCIIGEGEDGQWLKKIIKKNNLTSNVFLLGYKKNVFPYIAKSSAVLSTSLWEDPGAVMLEAAFLNKTIIVSDCPSGPKEFIEDNVAGYLFKNNNINSLVSAITEFKKESEINVFKKKINAKIKAKNFSLFHHFKKIKEILI